MLAVKKPPKNNKSKAKTKKQKQNKLRKGDANTERFSLLLNHSLPRSSKVFFKGKNTGLFSRNFEMHWKKYKMKAYSIPQKALRRPLRAAHNILFATEKVFIKPAFFSFFWITIYEGEWMRKLYYWKLTNHEISAKCLSFTFPYISATTMNFLSQDWRWFSLCWFSSASLIKRFVNFM